ncbi:MAG: ABC transporter permease [Gemmobacter sp.]|nr:ABC transporter permease [Gemmobacter sp.]
MNRMPPWADAVIVPLMSLIIAFLVSGVVILAIGESPVEAMTIMVRGALGSTYGWGHTLYYATNFVFTGLAVAIAFHAGFFNIGGEGQALLGGLGVALVCLFVPWPHWSLALIGAVVAGAAFGAAWAAIPAWLRATRGSHEVITTIMFNFIAASLLVYVLVHVLRPQGSMDPASRRFPPETRLPRLGDMADAFGIPFSKGAPANISLFLAIGACVLVWFIIWRTRLGYQIRALGKKEKAAVYAGISPVRITMYAMLMSGALAGLMAVNSTMGEANRLINGAAEGAGFIGIAVALMGRSHPFGVALAALLFGFLYQGGGELSLETSIPRDLIIVIQALVILFTGALDNLVRWPVQRAFAMLKGNR